MEKTFIERRVYKGAPVHRGYKVTGIKCVNDVPGSLPRELAKAYDIVGYSSGCPIHRGSCFGHMCVTPNGNLLPPHSLSFRSGDIRTQYYVASNKAFEDKKDEYIEALKVTNYGKHGHLRSIMSTPVSGSARLVCIPHGDRDPRIVYMSRSLAEGILFCCPETDQDGVQGSRYIERCLREGDYMMVERPPSLSKFNNQPLRLAFWDLECMGMHPKVFSFFHGDYDGDECHVYPLGDRASIEQASKWVAPLDKNLCTAEDYMTENFPFQYAKKDYEGDLEFIEYSTLSFKQIALQSHSLAIGNMVRNKAEHLKMFAERMNQVPGTSGFLEESVKGVRDIMRQQISQGKIGDMSRVARISAMCFTRGGKGGTYVTTRRTRVLLNPDTLPTTGCPSVRCIMVLCQASQEAALHAHRVGSSESAGVDLVSNLLMGRATTDQKNSHKTLVIMSGEYTGTAALGEGVSWEYRMDGHTALIVKDDYVNDESAQFVEGAFSPVVLACLPKPRRKKACKLALNVVYNYYGLKLERGDIDDMVEMMCYRVEDSVFPVTTRSGMLQRGLGWMETLMACDYTKLPQLAGSMSAPRSATSAAMCSTFSMLP